MGAAFAWTVYATTLTLLLAIIGLLANTMFRLEDRMDALGRDVRAGKRQPRAEMRDGFAMVDDRLQLLERHQR